MGCWRKKRGHQCGGAAGEKKLGVVLQSAPLESVLRHSADVGNSIDCSKMKTAGCDNMKIKSHSYEEAVSKTQTLSAYLLCQLFGSAGVLFSSRDNARVISTTQACSQSLEAIC